MLLVGLATNEHFAWKVAHVDYQSVAPTVNVCSSVGLTNSARFSTRYDESLHYLGGPIESVHYQSARFMAGQGAACRDAAREVCHLPLSYFGTPRLGHVISWYATIVNIPRLSATQWCLSTL